MSETVAMAMPGEKKIERHIQTAQCIAVGGKCLKAEPTSKPNQLKILYKLLFHAVHQDSWRCDNQMQ